jgi:hypothetical protein
VKPTVRDKNTTETVESEAWETFSVTILFVAYTDESRRKIILQQNMQPDLLLVTVNFFVEQNGHRYQYLYLLNFYTIYTYCTVELNKDLERC